MKLGNIYGIYWMLFHGLIVTVMFAIGKYLNAKMSLMQMIAAYNIFSFFIITLYLMFIGFWRIKTKKMHVHFLRSLFNIIGYIAYFNGLRYLSLDTASSISYLLPIVVSYLGTVFFNEKLSRDRVIALICGLIGMIIILKPGMQQLDMGAIWILLSVFAWSSSDVVTKKLGKTETVYSQTFYTTLFGSIIASSVAAFDTYEPIMVDDLFLLFLLGLLLILQIISIFKTFQHADFSVVMPFDYFRLPLTSLTSYLMFQEVMSLDTLIGSIIIISGGFYLVYHERKKHYYAMHH